jgi:hypothetical protein
MRVLIRIVLVVLCTCLTFSSAPANDSAASTALGGIQLKREPRISMQSEHLFVSEKKVRVEYEFFNDTDVAITTEVAFPIPQYTFELDDAGGLRDVADFHLWVDGQKLAYQVEVKALCGRRDCSALLQKHGVDVATFGHFDWDKMLPVDFDKLPVSAQKELMRAGLFEGEEHFPQWSVKKTYHWTQTFPSRRIIKVSHEYAPVIGFLLLSTGDLHPATRRKRVTEAQKDRKWYLETARQVENACVDDSLRNGIYRDAVRKGTKDPATDDSAIGGLFWVDYILTTANSWKTPIRRFDLEIERPTTDSRGRAHVSLCWDGNITARDANHFVAHEEDFVPKKELRVAFLRF